MKLEKITTLNLIRKLSADLSPKNAVSRLSKINLLTRYSLGLCCKSFAKLEAKLLGYELSD